MDKMHGKNANIIRLTSFALWHKRFWNGLGRTLYLPHHQCMAISTSIRTQRISSNAIAFVRYSMGQSELKIGEIISKIDFFSLLFCRCLNISVECPMPKQLFGCQYWNVNLFGLMRSLNIISKIISKCRWHGKHSSVVRCASAQTFPV